MAEGKKKYLERRAVPSFKVPTWPELSVKALLGAVMSDVVLKDYFPDKFPKGRTPERGFFWGVLFAVKPGFAKQLVHDAIQVRSNQQPQENVYQVNIQKTILKKMLEAPLF